MANKQKIIPFSVGDRVCYVGITGNAKRLGRICDVKSLYGGGYYKYKILFDGSSEADDVWYEHYNIQYSDEASCPKPPGPIRENKHPMFCRRCGRKLANDAVYCPQCGTKIDNNSNFNETANNYDSSYQTHQIVQQPSSQPLPINPVDEIDSYDDFLNHYAKKG